jgi:hypothetical protein
VLNPWRSAEKRITPACVAAPRKVPAQRRRALDGASPASTRAFMQLLVIERCCARMQARNSSLSIL